MLSVLATAPPEATAPSWSVSVATDAAGNYTINMPANVWRPLYRNVLLNISNAEACGSQPILLWDGENFDWGGQSIEIWEEGPGTWPWPQPALAGTGPRTT